MKFIFIIFQLVFIFQVSARPLIIAHRGASGHRPEHTLEAFQLAIEMGADFIEPDLVMTKDGVLIARHENEISETTNVSDLFPDRKTEKIIDGETHKGWFTEDFTLAEIKKLKAKQRVLIRSKKFDNLYEVPTFEEIIQLAQKKNVGIYPEIKHPTYFEKIKPQNKSIVEELAKVLKKYNYQNKQKQIFVQSFELDPLVKLKSLIDVPTVFLLGDKKEFKSYVESYEKFLELKKKVAGLGPHKSYLDDPQFMKWAKKAGLIVHPYTFREGDSKDDYQKYFKMGIDGLFTDFPDDAIKAKTTFQ